MFSFGLWDLDGGDSLGLDESGCIKKSVYLDGIKKTS